MTKREREITDPERIRAILDEGKVLHLALCDGDMPYVLPMNYGYAWENGTLTLYIHGALKGYKYEVLESNPNAAFSIECGLQPFEGDVACKYGMSYSSVLGRGVVHFLTNPEEKAAGLEQIMLTQTGKHFEIGERLTTVVRVMKLEVSEYTAKHRPMPKMPTKAE